MPSSLHFVDTLAQYIRPRLAFSDTRHPVIGKRCAQCFKEIYLSAVSQVVGGLFLKLLLHDFEFLLIGLALAVEIGISLEQLPVSIFFQSFALFFQFHLALLFCFLLGLFPDFDLARFGFFDFLVSLISFSGYLFDLFLGLLLGGLGNGLFLGLSLFPNFCLAHFSCSGFGVGLFELESYFLDLLVSCFFGLLGGSHFVGLRLFPSLNFACFSFFQFLGDLVQLVGCLLHLLLGVLPGQFCSGLCLRR